MKNLCLILSILLSMTVGFNSIAAFADNEDDKILTLEEAKALALENDVEFQQQQRNIEKANENYEEVYENNTGSIKADLDSKAEEAEYVINRKIAIENAAFNTRMAVFRRNSIKRTSDYNVTVAYYDVIKANYALESRQNTVKLKEMNLNNIKNKYNFGLITKSSLTEAEDEYEEAQKAYDDAFYDLQQEMNTLGRTIGKNLDVFNDKLDLTLNMVDISSIDLNKIKEDYMESNESFYKAAEELSIAEYKLDLFQEQYDYYYKKLTNPNTSKIINELEDMLYDAEKDYEEAKYSYDEMEDDLDETLASQYRTLNDLYESYDDHLKGIEDSKLEIEENRIKYQMRLISKTALEQSETSIKDLQNQLNITIISLNTQYMNMTQYSTAE